MVEVSVYHPEDVNVADTEVEVTGEENEREIDIQTGGVDIDVEKSEPEGGT